jgi:hypothetical protein
MGSFCLVEGKTKVVVPDAPVIGQNDVAVWAVAENKPGAKPWSVAEPQLDIWKGIELRNVVDFGLLGRLPLLTAICSSPRLGLGKLNPWRGTAQAGLECI